MYILKVLGIRRNVLAVHRCESQAELDELLSVYHALGYESKSLIIEDRRAEQAA